MLHDFAEVVVCVVVEAKVEVADDADLLKEVVVADVHLVTESVEVVGLVDTDIVGVESWSCKIPPSHCFSLSKKSEEIEKRPDAWIP